VRKLTVFPLLAMAMACAHGLAFAADRYWDANSSVAGVQAGDGNWTNANWNASVGGPGATNMWTFFSADAANFVARGDSIVTISGSRTVSSNVTVGYISDGTISNNTSMAVTLTNGALNITGR